MTFKEQMQADVEGVFLDTDEFAGVVSVSADCVKAFDWTCVVDTPRAALVYDGNGDTQTILRCHAEGSTAAMLSGGISELRRDIVVAIDGKSWGIELNESYWDDYMVKLSLVKNEIAAHQEMEARGPVR